jgi:hypothetical protein
MAKQHSGRWEESECAKRAPARTYGERERQSYDDFTELRTYDSETYAPKPPEWSRMHANPSQAD